MPVQQAYRELWEFPSEREIEPLQDEEWDLKNDAEIEDLLFEETWEFTNFILDEDLLYKETWNATSGGTSVLIYLETWENNIPLTNLLHLETWET